MGSYLKLRDDVLLYYKVAKSKNPNGVLVINHGFAEHLDRYDYITKKLVEKGFSVYRYDLRGHGRTKSKKGQIKNFMDFVEDAKEIVDMIKDREPSLPIFMLGHSMGGLITLLYGLNYPQDLRGQIFSGAAVGTLPSAEGLKGKLLKLANIFLPQLMIKNPITNHICSDTQVVKSYLEDPLILRRASLNFYVEFLVKGINLLENNYGQYNYPCLILHGEKDKIVPKEISSYLYENIDSKDKEIIIYENLYHEILNESIRDQIIEDIINWLEKRI